MQVLCIIPARGGSKGIPAKNLTRIAGKSLIYHAAECVGKSKKISRSVVSTDSELIAREAKRCGLEVPFLRPPELARDDTTDWPVFYHCLNWLKDKENYIPEIVVHLRVTSPFAFKRTGSLTDKFPYSWTYIEREKVIDQAVGMLEADSRLDSVRAVELSRSTPYKMWLIEKNKVIPLMKTEENEIYNQPRQKIPKVYLQNGYIDVSRYKTIINEQSMTGSCIGAYQIDCDYLVDIDTYSDIDLGQLLYQQIIKKEKNEH